MNSWDVNTRHIQPGHEKSPMEKASHDVVKPTGDDSLGVGNPPRRRPQDQQGIIHPLGDDPLGRGEPPWRWHPQSKRQIAQKHSSIKHSQKG
ncbi:hypothetical protein JTB14_003999 [Gonioctena quinquepunctata]|nr:hypothetical protein JTB14_003999 [Gonioctena quinquepunctata]